MIAKYFGKSVSLSDLVQLSGTTREGANLQGISEAAEKIGFRTLGVKIPYVKLLYDAPLPCIAHWHQSHFVVVYKIKSEKIYLADPAHGLLTYSKDEFLKAWVSDGKDEGILLLFETTPEFYNKDKNSYTESIKHEFTFLYSYLFKHRKAIVQLFFGLVAGSLLQLVFPFLAQSIVDIGIQYRDMHFINLILMSQLLVFFGRITIDVLRSYILMHVSSRINISLVSDFFVKLMKLPIRYFDSKMTGDIMQRINDNHRIENFLTGSSLHTLFSLFNFIIFSGVLAWYHIKVFTVFLLGSVVYFSWITFFLKHRADLDFKRFQQSSQNQSKVIELINGMQEIKLHNAERQKRWQWENLQAKLFKINQKGLSLTTAQNSGSQLINELKNIVITFLSAKLVLDGQITLGMMLSISYITGQLNAPVYEMVNFIQQWQDARLSLERLAEIHNKEEEEPVGRGIITEIEHHGFIDIQNLSFKYDGIGNETVISDLTITIPSKRITAIVGTSGSGKTTLMKLLLKFYEPTKGTIKLNEVNLGDLSAHAWRSKCGAVMQEGYIFNDTIANNIAVGEDVVDKERLINAVKVANVKEFIDGLPLRYNTKIGQSGIGISTGQKQRILIARAVYKNPYYLFFDEATSALDANNEKVIMENLNEFFKGRTVVVIAHRLSTVKNADQIIVLDKGKIIEKGTHADLTKIKGAYYELVKNQLELGS